MFDVFLSHNSTDKPAVEELAHRLRAAGIEPWLDKWNLIPGNPWQQEIEQAVDTCQVCAVFIGPSGVGPWQDEEMRAAIDRRVSEGNFRVIPVLLPGATRSKRSSLPTFLSATTWVEFRNTLDDEDAFHRLLSGVRGVAPGAVAGGDGFTPDVCPYRGLQVFDVEHAPLFFGRQALTEWLLEAIRPEDGKANRFLAMLGASGSGKSSLARAGLLAPLGKGELPDSQYWPQIILKPGTKPLESLAVALCHSGITDKNQGELIELFLQNNNQLHWLCRQTLHGRPDNRRIVLLVDQFEEVFTLCHDNAERTAFINNLLTAATDVSGQAVVLLTLRADFYGKCAAYPQLAAALSDDQFLISPMNEAELREAIEMPALRAGCELEVGLVDVLLRDVKDQPGSLPLLEYTLTLLWEQRESRVLRLADYQALGGLEGALNQRADAIYAGLSEEQQAICRHVFLRLVQPGEGTEDTRRRANLSEFGEDDETVAVVQKLADVRLITTQKAAGDGQAFAEVTHETLIRNWGQLREWIEVDRDSLKQRLQISQAAAEWEEHGKDDAWLLTGTRLELAAGWLRGNAANLSGLESRFLTQSQGANERRLATEKEEQERQRKSLIRTRWVSGVMAVLALLMVVAASFAWKSANDAELARLEAQSSAEIAQKKESEATQSFLEANYNLAKVFEEKAMKYITQDILAGKAEAIKPADLRRAWLYGLEAAKQQNISGNRRALSPITFGLLSVLREQDLSSERKQTPTCCGSGILTIAYSPNGKIIATGSTIGSPGDASVHLWDASTGGLLKALNEPYDTVNDLTFSPDGKFIAASSGSPLSGDGVVHLWNTDTGEILKLLQGHTGPINTLAFSPDGKIIATGSSDKTIRLWDVNTGETLKTLQGHTASVEALVFSPDGRIIATGSTDDTVLLWDANSNEILNMLLGHTNNINELAFSLDSNIIAVGSSDNTTSLWNVNKGDLLEILLGHTGSVNTLAFSPDNQLIATGSSDKTIRLWNVNTGDALKILQGHTDSVETLAFSPDGKAIAAASFGDSVRLWDIHTGEAFKKRNGHSRTLNALAFSPNGKIIATGSSDNTIRLWDARTGKTIKVLKGDATNIRALAFSSNGNVIATGSETHFYGDGVVHLWDTRTGENLKTLHGHTGIVKTLAFSPNGKVIATGSSDNTIRLWDLSTGTTLKILQGHIDSVNTLAFSPDGRVIATGSADDTVLLWDVDSNEILNMLLGHTNDINALEFSPDGKVIATGSSDSTIRFWDTSSGETLKKLQGHTGSVNTVTFSPDGKVIATGSEDKTVHLWNVSTGTLMKIIQGHRYSVNALAFSSDGKVIATASEDNTLRLWDANTNETLKMLEGHTNDINVLTFSSDGKIIATGSEDKTVHLWNVSTGGNFKILRQEHTGSVNTLAFSPDDKVIATGSSDNTIRLWDVSTGETLKVLQGHTSYVRTLAFSPDGKIIATGSADNTVRLWKASTGEILKILQGHTDWLNTLAFSPDGEIIATGSADNTIRLWDVDSGKLLKVLQGHTRSIRTLAFNPNGKVIATGSADNTVRLWKASTGEIQKILQGHTDWLNTLAFSPDDKVIATGSSDNTIRLWDVDTGETLKILQGHTNSVRTLAFSPDGNIIATSSADNTVRLWNFSSPIHRLLYDLNSIEVSSALSFIWEIDIEGLEVVHKPHHPSLFPQMGHHITFTNKTRKFRPLLDAPRPDETKLAQVVRFLEERCAYKHPERYNCTPATD